MVLHVRSHRTQQIARQDGVEGLFRIVAVALVVIVPRQVEAPGSIPRVQSLRVKAMSSPACANTKLGQDSFVFVAFGVRRAVPSRSVLPAANSTPCNRGCGQWRLLPPRSFRCVTQTNAPTAGFHMHGQIGHQCHRAHVHRALLLQQRVAESCRFSLNNVQSRLGQRQADDFELLRSARFRQGQRLCPVLPFSSERPRMSSRPSDARRSRRSPDSSSSIERSLCWKPSVRAYQRIMSCSPVSRNLRTVAAVPAPPYQARDCAP